MSTTARSKPIPAEPRKPSTWIELSRTKLRSNLRFLHRRIGSTTTFTSVVKGNAYGHGIETYVPLAESCGVRHFMVFSADEAARALEARTQNSEVVIMGDLAAPDVPWAVDNGVGFFVFDLGRLDAALEAAKRTGKAARVHLEIETGLYRTGLSLRSLERAAKRLYDNPDLLQPDGLCTHMAGAETFANYHRISRQLQAFDALSRRFDELGFSDVPRHVACSAAAFNYPEEVRDRVRFGIAQYGFWPSEETRMTYLRGEGQRRARAANLTAVMSWKSRIMNLKSVPRGEFVGYGNSFQAPRRMRVAAVPSGYYHGFPRSQSNLGTVLVGGRPAQVVGSVNMNMVLVDVTDVPETALGQEVVLIGEQGDTKMSVGAFGERTHTLNYEVLVRLPSSIPRVVVD